MRKLLSVLILITFVITMQMPFIHVLDMAMNTISNQALMGTESHSVGGDFCDSSGTSTTGSCFTETPEIKYLQSVKKIELTLFLFAVIFISFVSLIFLYPPNSSLHCFQTENIVSRDAVSRIIRDNSEY